ncbi:uncharacterized protein PAN0_001d0404 [Moesziomyces antarcticus]|uniref:uncharacterized protein n=1 Tax=Pseudozyma antarctica TaxID=84753 RepID=UPI0007195273|nr:uncharacterized protein PAN0_001d0404 [Moesziomyces antarcticus]GAK62206.1 hypothetical protein PAN0_001d0404 [Moesziomyces antarcticus]
MAAINDESLPRGNNSGSESSRNARAAAAEVGQIRELSGREGRITVFSDLSTTAFTLTRFILGISGVRSDFDLNFDLEFELKLDRTDIADRWLCCLLSLSALSSRQRLTSSAFSTRSRGPRSSLRTLRSKSYEVTGVISFGLSQPRSPGLRSSSSRAYCTCYLSRVTQRQARPKRTLFSWLVACVTEFARARSMRQIRSDATTLAPPPRRRLRSGDGATVSRSDHNFLHLLPLSSAETSSKLFSRQQQVRPR